MVCDNGRFYSRNTLECVTQSIIEIFCLSRKGTPMLLNQCCMLYKRFISNPIKEYRLHKQQLWGNIVCFPFNQNPKIIISLLISFLIRVQCWLLVRCSVSKYSYYLIFLLWIFKGALKE